MRGPFHDFSLFIMPISSAFVRLRLRIIIFLCRLKILVIFPCLYVPTFRSLIIDLIQAVAIPKRTIPDDFQTFGYYQIFQIITEKHGVFGYQCCTVFDFKVFFRLRRVCIYQILSDIYRLVILPIRFVFHIRRVIKCVVSYAFNTVGERYFRQFTTIPERAVSDFLHAVLYRYARKRSVIKRHVFYPFDFIPVYRRGDNERTSRLRSSARYVTFSFCHLIGQSARRICRHRLCFQRQAEQ